MTGMTHDRAQSFFRRRPGAVAGRVAGVALDGRLGCAEQRKAIYWFYPPGCRDFCVVGERIHLESLDRFTREDIRFALPARELYLEGQSAEEPAPAKGAARGKR